jgi:hypothetical protein
MLGNPAFEGNPSKKGTPEVIELQKIKFSSGGSIRRGKEDIG